MKKFLILLSALLLSVQAQAALVATPGNTFLADTTILLEDGLTNTEQQAFNEVQGYTLGSDLTFTNHYGSTTIVAGTTVDSHIIFLNTAGDTDAYDTRTWTFDGDILGVMEDDHGAAMAATDLMFANGSYFTDAGGSGFTYQGLEIGLFSLYDDFSLVSLTQLEVKMSVSEPGDWIRVLTASSVSAVPVPAALFLFAPALLGFLGLRRKVSSTVA